MGWTRPSCMLMILLWVAVPAGAQDADSSAVPDPVQAEADASWLSRTLSRYFGNKAPSGQALKGRAVEIVDTYAEHAGKIIEVVIVHQVVRFKEGWDQDKSYSQRILNDLTSPLSTYTQDGVIRDFLLFKRGDVLDPFALADSEHLLRELIFINDARILVVPLGGDGQSVAIVVETTDNWPLGVDAKIITSEKYSFRIFSTNVAGTGLRFDNELLHKETGDPQWGYRGRLRKENLGGSFLDADLEFEDSYRNLRRRVALGRRLLHPAIRYIGGASWQRYTEREVEENPYKYDTTDFWVGRAIRLYDPYVPGDKARPLLVPALRFSRIDYIVRPDVAERINLPYHDRWRLLAGITYQQYRYYKTSYLFRHGETENMLSGHLLKLSYGYEQGEFQKRPGLFLVASKTALREKGDILYGDLSLGSYYRRNHFEQGVLKLGGGFITPLLGRGNYHHRWYTELTYTLGIGRFSGDRLFLNSPAGIRGMTTDQVRGNQRLVGTLENRLFTPWSVMGFRWSIFGFVDAGMVGGEEDPIFKQKIYTSGGLGFQVHNPDLVFPTVQIRLSLLTNDTESGIRWMFQLGNVSYPTISVPGPAPGVLSYN